MSNTMSELQDMIADLDLIVYRLRKVKSGDLIMSSDHNDLVDSVYQITRIIKKVYYGGLLGGCSTRPSGVDPYTALYKLLKWGLTSPYFPIIDITNTGTIDCEDFVNCIICQNSCADGSLFFNQEEFMVNVFNKLVNVYSLTRELIACGNLYPNTESGIALGLMFNTMELALIASINIHENEHPDNYPDEFSYTGVYTTIFNLDYYYQYNHYYVLILDNVLYLDTNNSSIRNKVLRPLFTFERDKWYFIGVYTSMDENQVKYPVIVIFDNQFNKVFDLALSPSYIESLIADPIVVTPSTTLTVQIYIYEISQVDSSGNNIITYRSNSKIDYIAYASGIQPSSSGGTSGGLNTD